MRVNSVNTVNTNQKRTVNNQTVKSAKMGAVLTGGTIAVTQAYHWISKPDTMRKIVSENGGKIPYIKNLMLATAMYTLLGATLSALVSKIADRVSPIELPRAGN